MCVAEPARATGVVRVRSRNVCRETVADAGRCGSPGDSTVPMATLIARDVSLSFGPDPVLAAVSCTLAPGHRVGVVGPNGTGKSTLLRVLAGLTEPDAGSVTVAPPTATVGLLPQEPDRRTDETVADFLARRTGVGAAAARMERATRRSPRASTAPTTPTPTPSTGGSRSAAPTWRRGRRRRSPTSASTRRVLDQATASLSGGQAARVSLAATLLARFDVFLLDEPTNDLDFDGLDRLEEFLAGLDAAVAVVSHDRAFLDRVVTDVLELDEHDHAARCSAVAGPPTSPTATWPAATRRRTTRPTASSADAGDRARTQREWSVQGAKRARDIRRADKFIRHFRINSSEKVAAKAKATEQGARPPEQCRQAVGGLGPPVRDRHRRPQRRRRRPPRRRGGRPGLFRLGPSTWRSGGPTGWRSSAPTAPARPRCSTPCSVDELTAGERSSGPGSWSASWSSAGRVRHRPPLLEVVSGATGLQAKRSGRCWPSSGSAPTTCRPSNRCHRASAPGPTSPCSWPGRQLPRPRRAHEPPRPAGHRAARAGARPLRRHRPAVSHDRAFLEPSGSPQPPGRVRPGHRGVAQPKAGRGVRT